jgi:ABC-2 type transport system ATP-binding protein
MYRVGIIDHGKILIMDDISNLKNSVGKDVITLACDDLNKLKNKLEEENWISKIKQHETTLTLGVEKGDEKIPIIIEIAQKINVKIKSISVRKPTLDDVFLSYTGRTIRDDEQKNNLVNSKPYRFRGGHH